MLTKDPNLRPSLRKTSYTAYSIALLVPHPVDIQVCTICAISQLALNAIAHIVGRDPAGLKDDPAKLKRAHGLALTDNDDRLGYNSTCDGYEAGERSAYHGFHKHALSAVFT